MCNDTKKVVLVSKCMYNLHDYFIREICQIKDKGEPDFY